MGDIRLALVNGPGPRGPLYDAVARDEFPGGKVIPANVGFSRHARRSLAADFVAKYRGVDAALDAFRPAEGAAITDPAQLQSWLTHNIHQFVLHDDEPHLKIVGDSPTMPQPAPPGPA